MAEKRTRTVGSFVLSVIASIVAALILNWFGIIKIDPGKIILGGNVSGLLLLLLVLPVAYVLLRIVDLIATIIDFFQDLFGLS